MEKLAEYYLARFKSVLIDTNKLTLLFLFTLIYVWQKSVNPTSASLKNIITSKEQCTYFDSIYNPLKKSFTTKLNDIYAKRKDTVEKNYRLQNKNQLILKYPSLTKDYLKHDSNLIKSIGKRKKIYNNSVLPIKRFRDSITSKLQDSLSQSQFKIDIPTLSSIEVDINVGIPIWMFLTTFFIALMYSRRNKAFTYLQKSLTLFHESSALSKFYHLDVSIPFWMQPIKIDPDEEFGNQLNSLIGNARPLLSRVFIAFVIAILLIIQYRTLTIIWNKHFFWEQYRLFDAAYLSRAVCFLMMAISVVISVMWLSPKRIKLQKVEKEFPQTSSRRKFIAFGAILFAAQFIKPQYLFSAIKPEKFNFHRPKPTKHENVFVPSLRGFYINKRKKYQTIHYFDKNGQSPVLKKIPQKDLPIFLGNLKPIDILQFNNLPHTAGIGFPQSVWSVEDFANELVEKGEPLKALKLLQIGIELNFYGESRTRLISNFQKKLEANSNLLTLTDLNLQKKQLVFYKRKIQALNKSTMTSK